MAEDAPPKAVKADPPPKATTKGAGKKSQGRPLALETELKDLFTQMGAMVMMADQFDGLVIVNQAEDNAKALAKLANKNARVKKALETLTAVSALSGVVGVVGATAIPILMHHGVVPVQLPMPDGWLQPPEQEAFIAEMQRKAAEQKSESPGAPNGQP
jgi:hypothetical protein